MQTTRTQPEEAQLQALEDEQRRAVHDRSTVWGFIWVLFLFKIATVAATAWAAGFTAEASVLLSITTWPWLIVPALAFSGSLIYRYRLRRVRARRLEMQRSEWVVHER